MYIIIFNFNLNIGIMVNVLASSAVERGFKRVCQTKDYTIGICWFSEALRSKNKDWVDQNNVSEWSDMSTIDLLFQWASTIKIQLGVLV